MRILSNGKLHIAVAAIALLAIVIMGAAGVNVYGAHPEGIAIFILFIIFYVQIPGLVLIRLLGLKPEHMSTALMAGFYMGWAFELVMYFAANYTGTDIILYGMGPLLSLVYIIISIREGKDNIFRGFRPGRISMLLAITIALCFYYSMCTTQYGYMSPEISDFTYLYKDDAYHMGIINALAEGYPADNPWFAGRTLNYHFLTEMLYAIPVRLFGLTSDFMIMSCAPYLIAYAFPMSAYSFFMELCARRDYSGAYCLMAFAANMFLTVNEDKSWLYTHIFSNVNSFCFGMSAAFIAVVIIKYWNNALSEGGSRIRLFVILAVLMVLVTGIKGPVGAVLLAAVWSAAVLGVILRKVRVRALLYSVVLTICFGAVYKLIIGGSSGGKTGEDLISPGQVTDYFFLKDSIMDFGQQLGLSGHVTSYALALIYMCFIATAFTIPFVIGYIREVILVLAGKKDYLLERVTVYAFAAIGLLAMMVLNFNGSSQVYFGFAGACMIPAIAYWFFEDFHGRKNDLVRAVAVAFAMCLVLSSCTMFVCLEKKTDSVKDYAANYNQLDRSSYKSITGEEYEALAWIRDNTPEDALLATNRYYSLPLEYYHYDIRGNNNFYLYAVYSDRKYYFEGAGYSITEDEFDQRLARLEMNDKLYDAANNDRGQIARELGVSYVVVSKDFGDFGSLENEDYKMCFSNEAVDIYEITD